MCIRDRSEGTVVEEGHVKDIFEHPQHMITKRFVRDISSKVDDDKLNADLKLILSLIHI